MIAFALLQLLGAPASGAEAAVAVERARALAAEFKYAEAVAALCVKDLCAADADTLLSYAALIGREERLFKKVAERYEAGSCKLWMLFPEDGRIFRVAGISKEGVEVVSESEATELNEMRVLWARMAQSEVIKLFEGSADLTSAEERLALAVLAFHRGLAPEYENQRKAATVLDPAFEGRVGEMRVVLRRVEELRPSH